MMTLTLHTLEGYDPEAPNTGAVERWFCCCLPKCARYPIDPAHRVLLVNVKTGVWCCNRCMRAGVLAERCASWKPSVRQRAEKPPIAETTAPRVDCEANDGRSCPETWGWADQDSYESALAEIAAALPEADLIDWLAGNFGCLLSLDERGKLKAKDAVRVPLPVRAVVTERQEGLVVALKEASEVTCEI